MDLTEEEFTHLLETDLVRLHRVILGELIEERGEDWVVEHRRMLDRQCEFFAAMNGWSEAEIEHAIEALRDYPEPGSPPSEMS